MSSSLNTSFAGKVATALQFILNIGLLFLAGMLIIFLCRETFFLFHTLLISPQGDKSYDFVESLLTWFLYFEFIALAVIYFQSGYHFPLRYFIYIGITAIVRLIIVDHESPVNVMLYSVAILILVMALWLCNSSRLKRE